MKMAISLERKILYDEFMARNGEKVKK